MPVERRLGSAWKFRLVEHLTHTQEDAGSNPALADPLFNLTSHRKELIMTEADEEITKSIYWQMLGELEYQLEGDDALLKLLIEGAYRHWNKITGKNLVPDHVLRTRDML